MKKSLLLTKILTLILVITLNIFLLQYIRNNLNLTVSDINNESLIHISDQLNSQIGFMHNLTSAVFETAVIPAVSGIPAGSESRLNSECERIFSSLNEYMISGIKISYGNSSLHFGETPSSGSSLLIADSFSARGASADITAEFYYPLENLLTDISGVTGITVLKNTSDSGLPDELTEFTSEIIQSAESGSPAAMSTNETEGLVILPLEKYSGVRDSVLIAEISNPSLALLYHNSKIILILLIVIFITITAFIMFIHIKQRIVKDLIAHDPLTGAFSRMQIFNLLKGEYIRSKRYGTPVSIILFDIDHFKQLNDKYHKTTGDSILQIFSKTIMKDLRTTDHFGRIGGDQFMLLLPETDRDGAYQLGKLTLERIHQTSFPEIGKLSCSMGIGEISESDSSLDAFIDRIESGLYLSKQTRRDQITVVASIS